MRFGKWLGVTALALLGIVVAAPFACVRTQYIYSSNASSEQLKLAIEKLRPEDGDVLQWTGAWSGSGAWTLADENVASRWARLSIVAETATGSSTTYQTVPIADVKGLPVNEAEMQPGPVSFSIQRKAGILNFTGKRDGAKASGTVRLVPAPEFVKAINALYPTPPSAADLLGLVLADVESDYVAALQKGYGATAGQILAAHNGGLSAAYASGFSDAGYTYALDDVIRLRNGGASVEYAKGLRDAGYQLTPDELIKLRNSGVSVEYARDIKATGIEFTLDQLIKLRNGGVSVEFAKGMVAAGVSKSTDEMIKLRNSGISVEYAAATRKAGYDLSINDLVKLRNNGVSAEYLAALTDPKRKNLSVDQIVDLRRRGMDAETVKKLREE